MRLAIVVLVGACLLPVAAHADGEVQRLLDAKRTLAWNAAPSGKSQRYGHAETLVDAPADKLTVARGRQVSIEGWQRPVKKPK